MSKKTNSYKKKSKVSARSSLLSLLPLMAVVGIVPLIVRLYAYDCGLEYYDFFETPEAYKAHDGSFDVFLFWKMTWFIIFASVMAVIVIVKLINEKKQIKFLQMFIPLGAYAFLALASSVLSEFRYFSFRGIYEQFESVWALLGYCLVAYYAFLYINNERDMKLVLWALTFSTVILILIGISQAFFTDFYRTKLAEPFIVPAEFRSEDATATLGFLFEKGRVYLSLYNPNYVGSYTALLVPLFIMLVFAADKVWKKIASGVIVAGLIMALLASQSKAGFIGFAVSLLLVPVIFNKKLIKNWIPVVIAAVLIAGLIVGYDRYTDGYMFNRIKDSLKPSLKEFNLDSIQTLDNEIVFSYKGNDLHAVLKYEKTYGLVIVDLKDDRGDPVESVKSENKIVYTVTDERFKGFRIEPVRLSDTEVGFSVVIDGKTWNFWNKGDTYYMITPRGKAIKAANTESIDWLVHTTNFASGRGYIWGKTIPLLKHYIVLGSGADTFTLVFPNYDYLSLYNGGYDAQLVTKPHNMYMQMGVQTGVLSVIAFLAFYIWFFCYGIRTCFRIKKFDYMSFVGAGILIGSAGYMVVQIINDSSITVAPIYWTLVGAGIAAFTYVRKSENYVPKEEV